MVSELVAMIFIAGCVLTFLCLSRKRAIEKQGKQKQLAFHFYKNSLDFLVPLVLVVSFYFSLIMFASIAMDQATLGFLVSFERTLVKLKPYFSIFEPNALIVLGILLLFYLLAVLRLPTETLKKMFKLFDKYHLATKRIYIVLVLLSSFTLFGPYLGQPTRDLKVRINAIREGYADVHQEVKAAITNNVMRQLYTKTYNAFPDSYHKALQLPVDTESRLVTLRSEYVSAQEKYGIKIGAVESAIDAGDSRIKQATALVTDVKIPEGRDKEVKVPEQITFREIKAAKRSLSQYQDAWRLKVITLLKIEGGKRVTAQLPKVLTSGLKAQLFGELIKTHPILETVVDVFFGTIDDELETRVDSEVDRLTATIANDPKNPQTRIEAEAAHIVDQKKLDIPAPILVKAESAAEPLKNELATIEVRRTQINQEVSRVEGLGKNLLFAYSPDCPRCSYQRPIIDEFARNHPEISVQRAEYSRLNAEQRQLIRGTSGHPVMVFSSGNDVTRVRGETELTVLEKEYEQFKRKLGSPEGSFDTGGSGIVCH